MSQYESQSGRPLSRAALLALAPAVAALVLPAPRVRAAEPVPGSAAARAERKVRLDFVQGDINDVAKALSIQSGMNVVLMPSVKGTVTVRLIDVSLDEALRKTAIAVGADVRRFDTTYFIGTPAELKAMVARSGVRDSYAPKYTKASVLKELVQHSFPYLTAESVGESVLVLAGTSEDVAAATQMARDSDVAPPPPPKVEPAKLAITRDTYTVKFAKATNLAEMISRAVPELKVSQVAQTLVLEGTQPNHATATKLIAALDVQGAGERTVRAYKLKWLHPQQAAFVLKKHFPNLTISEGFESYTPPRAEFKPLSVETEMAFSQQGLQGNQSAAGGAGAGAGAGAGGEGGSLQMLGGPGSRARDLILAGPSSEIDQATAVIESMDVAPQQVLIEARVVDITPSKTKQLGFLYDWSSLSFTERNGGKQAYKFGGWARAPFNWSVTLEALEQTRDAKILAKPNIAVIDGEEASIFIGDILRYERLSSQTAVGDTFTIETVPVGVALLCRPRVNADGKITLRVHPVVSTVTGFTGRNRDIPITASREAESTIMVNDGETIAIGGLLREEEINLLTKIPILGDLPFLGNLFRHRNSSKRKSEVTIFITTKLLK